MSGGGSSAAVQQPLPADTDSTSGCSADGSNTDSGRGGSEEGDQQLIQHGGNMPTPAHYGTHHATDNLHLGLLTGFRVISQRFQTKY